MKKSISICLAVLIAFSLTACGSSSAGEVKFESRSDIEAKLTNYKITVEFTDEAGNKTEMTEMRCDQGYIWIIGESMLYIEYGTGKQYTLYRENKSGIATKLDDDGSYKTFGTVISAYLFFYNSYINFDITRSGSEKIAGRNTTGYKFKTGEYENKFWADNEYGVTMKYNIKTSTQTGAMEVKELKVGGVTLDEMVDLSEYDIADLSG